MSLTLYIFIYVFKKNAGDIHYLLLQKGKTTEGKSFVKFFKLCFIEIHSQGYSMIQ